MMEQWQILGIIKGEQRARPREEFGGTVARVSVVSGPTFQLWSGVRS